MSNIKSPYTQELSSLFPTIINGTENKTISPSDLSFEDYKLLSAKELDKIFGKYGEKHLQAYSLKSISRFSNDDILNNILFENELNDIEKDDDSIMIFMLAIALSNFGKIKAKSDTGSSKVKEAVDISDTKNSKEVINYLKNIRTFFENILDTKTDEIYIDKERMFQIADEIVKKHEEGTRKI